MCKACGDKVMENGRDLHLLCKIVSTNHPNIEEVTDYVIFFCGHIYHKRCAAVKDTVITSSTLHCDHHHDPVYSYYAVSALLALDQSEMKVPPSKLSGFGLLFMFAVFAILLYDMSPFL